MQEGYDKKKNRFESEDGMKKTRDAKEKREKEAIEKKAAAEKRKEDIAAKKKALGESQDAL